MKNLLLLILLFWGFKSYSQFTDIQFYPNDSVCKRAISFNNNTIYAVGNADRCFSDKFELYKSIDKGLNWSLINQVDINYNIMNFVSFSDSFHFMAAKHAIYNTYDAFNTTNCIICNFQTYPTSIKAINKDTIIIFDKGKLYVSYDGFNTWDTITISSLSEKIIPEMDEISIINDSVWITYLNRDCALIKTTNTGSTWEIIKDLSAYTLCDAGNSAVSFSTENIGLLHINNKVYSTADGANSFKEILNIRQNSYFIEMNSFPSGWTYIMTINSKDSNNTIYYSKDYGYSWDSLNYYYQENRESLYDLNYYNDSLIFALTFDGKMLKLDMSPTDNIVTSSLLAKIYPNPSIDIINIEIEGATNWHYNIFDPLGRLIQQRTCEGKNYKIDISSFTKGMYYIEIVDLKNSNKLSKKIIKL